MLSLENRIYWFRYNIIYKKEESIKKTVYKIQKTIENIFRKVPKNKDRK